MFTRHVHITLHTAKDSNGNHVFRPGTVVQGVVSFKSPSSDRLSSITVDFRGASHVNIKSNSGHSHQDKVQLFHRQCTIKSEGSGRLNIQARKTYNFPFQFIAPEMTELDGIGSSLTDGEDKFVDEQHPLPPSIGSDQSQNAQVVYEMYAVVRRVSDMGGHQYHAPISHSLPNLQCLPNSPPSSASPFAGIQVEPSRWFQQPMLDTSVLQNLSTLLAVDSAPLPTLETILNLPSTFILGEPIPITVIVCPKTPHNHSGRQFEAGEREISISATLQAETYSRCRNLKDCPPFTETKQQLLTDTRPSVSSMQIGEPKSFACGTQDVASWPSSCKSYLVGRSYTLLVDVGINKKGSKRDYAAQFKVPITAAHPQDSHWLPPYSERLPEQLPEQLPAYNDLRSYPLGVH